MPWSVLNTDGVTLTVYFLPALRGTVPTDMSGNCAGACTVMCSRPSWASPVLTKAEKLEPSPISLLLFLPSS